jgi:hypothetical protein
MREGRAIGLLNDILGFAVIPNDAAGNSVKPAIMRPHYYAESIGIPDQRPSNKFDIVPMTGWGNCLCR